MSYSFFFQRRWPHGFQCPRCSHHQCYTITTRRLPLYQCRLCKHQTTLTAGTVMDRSRTPLDKWAAAIELLASADGVNAVQLASGIGVSHKTAWNMLRKLRQAISELDGSRKLQGTVRAGVRHLGRYLFFPHIRYRKEHVILISASCNHRDMPEVLKLNVVPDEYLEGKTLTYEGRAYFYAQCIDRSNNRTAFLTNRHMVDSPLRNQFDQAAAWLRDLFHGLGETYLQSYLDEYCFRWNAKARNASLHDEWAKVCLHPSA